MADLAELTAVSVDELGVDKTDFEVVEHGRLVEVAERCEVILAHQDVRVPQVRQVLRLGVQLVLEALRRKRDTERTIDSRYINKQGGTEQTEDQCKTRLCCCVYGGLSDHDSTQHLTAAFSPGETCSAA